MKSHPIGSKEAIMKKIGLGMIILILAIFLFGCANDKVKFSVGFADNTSFGYRENDSGETVYGGIALVCTLEELKKLCDQWNNGAFNLESVGYSDMMNQKLREYDNEYFAAKALIIYSNMKWNWEREPRIETISKKNNVLVIEVSLKRGTYTDKAEAGTFFIELNKADVENVTDFRIEETTR